MRKSQLKNILRRRRFKKLYKLPDKL